MANATIYVTPTGNDSTGDGSFGNPFATPGKAGGAITGSGNTIYIKAGTYACTSATANVAGGQLAPPAGAAGAPNRIVGYNSTVGDLDDVADFSNFPIFRGSASGPSRMIQASSTNYVWVANLIIDGNSQASYGFDMEGGLARIVNCKALGCTTRNYWLDGAGTRVVRCLSVGSQYGFYCDTHSVLFTGCVATAATVAGFAADSYPSTYIRCIAYANTGSTVDGFLHTGSYGSAYINCVAHGNGRDGIRLASTNSADVAVIRGCILTGNGGYGVNSATTAWAVGLLDYNAYYLNTSGPANNVPTGSHYVTLTGDPFTNAAAGDFSLNSTAGAGAACRAAGFPGAFPGGLTTGYLDIGAVQHQDSGGGGGSLGASLSRIFTGF